MCIWLLLLYDILRSYFLYYVFPTHSTQHTIENQFNICIQFNKHTYYNACSMFLIFGTHHYNIDIKYLAHLQITVFNTRGDGGGGGFSFAVYSMLFVCILCVIVCGCCGCRLIRLAVVSYRWPIGGRRCIHAEYSIHSIPRNI